MLHRDEEITVEGGERCDSYRLLADEEEKLPFPAGTFDLVISSQSIHWINNLPGLFKEVKVRFKGKCACAATLMGALYAYLTQ
jgi:NADH dehydrogenase [ubiquinone] 1 alpha subcomplex assembly factor 5